MFDMFDISDILRNTPGHPHLKPVLLKLMRHEAKRSGVACDRTENKGLSQRNSRRRDLNPRGFVRHMRFHFNCGLIAVFRESSHTGKLIYSN